MSAVDACALEKLPAIGWIHFAFDVLIFRVTPVETLHCPAFSAGFYFAYHATEKYCLAQGLNHIRKHPAVFGKLCQNAGSIKRNQAGFMADQMTNGCVGISHEDFWVILNHIQIKIR